MAERIASVLIYLILISVVTFLHGFLEVIPERAGVEYINKKYGSGSINVRKTGRGGIYIANIDFISKNTFANNVTVHLLAYELLHNEYRPSFVEFHLTLCKFIEKDMYFGLALRRVGLRRCPIVEGEYQLHNITFAFPEIQNTKFVFPFEKVKFRAILELTTTNETIASGYMMLTIRTNQRKISH